MKMYLYLFSALLFIINIRNTHASNNSCLTATNFTANLSLVSQNYQTSDSVVWYKFKTDSAAIKISVNINSSAPVMPFNIKRITLYSGVCDTLNLVNFTNTLNSVNHRLSLFQLNLDTTVWYYVKITRQYQPFCGSCDTGLVNLNIEMNEYDLRMPTGGWPQPFQDSCTFSQCENLVCNGGFELHDSLNDPVQGSTNFSVVEDDVFNWNAYSELGAYMSTPDYYNTNQGIISFQVPNLPALGLVNHLPAMTGFVGTYDGYAGFATYNGFNSVPEALHQTLNTPLLPNRSYYCSYWVRLAPGSARVCNNPVALYLTQNAGYNVDFEDVYDGLIPPALAYTNIIPLTNPNWSELRTCFTPTDTLRSLYLLSAYKRTSPKDTINVNQNPNILNIGYYFVDNVMVRPMAYIAATDTVNVKNCGSIDLGTCAIPNGIDTLGNTLDYFTYHWQVIDSLSDFSSGAPVLSDTSTSEINLLVFSNTTLALSVYHIDALSGDTICIDRDTVTVLPDPECCLLQAQEQYLDSVTWAYQASGNSYNFNSTTMSINGDFILNHPNYSTVNIIGTEIVFGPKGRIIVPPTITLNIEDSYLHGCSEMWNGIVVSGDFVTPNLYIINSLIEDADTAINFMPSATGMHLVGSTFNKNYVDLVTSGVNNFPQIQEISSNTFDCQNSITPTTYTPNGLRIPRNGMRSAIAIKAFDANSAAPPNSITLTVGANSSTGNNFYNHDFGILTSNLNLNAAFNTFKNVNDNSSNSYTFTVPKGTNIQCDNTNASNIWAILQYNSFLNGVTAIDIRNGLNARLDSNEINEMSNYGIVFLSNKKKSIRVVNNEIDNVVWTGIYGLNNPNSTILIFNNKVFNTSNALARTGIALDELTSPIAFGYNSQVMGNTITNLQYGITHTSVYNPRIFSNTITIQPTPWAQYSHGIRLLICSKSHVRGNTIFGNNRDEYFVDGIRLDNGIGGGQIDCNYTVKTSSGVFFAGSSITSANVYSNVFLKDFWGVVVANDASIGSQYNTLTNTSRANQWIGSMGNPDYAHTLAYSAFGSLSPFFTLTGYPWQPTVNDFGGITFDPIPWFPVTNNQSENCVLYRPNLDTALFLIAPIGSGIDEAELMMQINNTDFNQNSLASAWWSRASAFTQLKANESIVLTNNDLLAFKDSVDVAPLGQFTEIDESLSDTLDANIDSLKIVNNSMSTNNVIEDLMKVINSIKMDYTKNNALTEIQMIELREIAALCPYADGPAVYTARALLRGLDSQRQEYMHECEKVYPTSNSNRESANQIGDENNLFSKCFAITPNPAQSNIAITHYGNFQNIKITEISGKVVLESNLNTARNIEHFNVSDLANGVYIVNLIADNKTERMKLIIKK